MVSALRFRHAFLIAFALIASACAESASAPAMVATVEVVGAEAGVAAGETIQLQATARSRAGNVLLGRRAIWSTDNASVATVSATGLVTAVAPGPVMITATAEGRVGQAMLTVGPARVGSVIVTPDAVAFPVATARQLTATARDSRGATLPDRAVAWTSGNTAVATVNAQGLVTGVSAGSAVITATSEGTSGTATVTVQAAPVTRVAFSSFPAPFVIGDVGRVRVSTSGSANQVFFDRPVTFSTSNPAVVTITNTGEVSAAGLGTATITATSEGVSSTLDFTILDVAPAFEAGSCNSVGVGQTCTVAARLRYVGTGQVVPSSPTLTITSQTPAIASTGPSSVQQPVSAGVTGVSRGQATLIATYTGATGITRTRTTTLFVF